jgi:hypothetical protein
MTQVTGLRPDDSALAGQVRAILQEVLEGSRLPENAKDRLRLLMAEHPGHPERVLVEHFRALRKDAAADRELLSV